MNLLFNKRDNQKNEVFPYRERYLEHILKKGETVEKYETMLGELYIDKLFQDAAKDLEEDLLDHEKINPMIPGHRALYKKAGITKLQIQIGRTKLNMQTPEQEHKARADGISVTQKRKPNELVLDEKNERSC